MFDPTTTVLHLEQSVPIGVDDFETRLGDIAQVRSWLSHKHAETVRALALIEAGNNPRTGPKRARERVRAATGCSDGQARRDTANAEQLNSMNSTRTGLSEGQISSANAEALARLRQSLDGSRRELFDAEEEQLAGLAAEQDSERFRKTLRDWTHINSGDDGIDDSKRRIDRRRLTITSGDDAMGILRAELDPEALEGVRRAITDVANEMWHGTHSAHLEGAPHITNNQRLMADALVELCRRGSTVTAAGARHNRPTVIVTIPYQRLAGELSAAGIGARLSNGNPIPAETARRLACNANLVPVVLGGKGQPLNVGRSRRLATDAQRSALRTSHPTCAAHGCERSYGWCDIHHIKPWEVGGPTDLENLVPLCSHHHHLIHEGGWAFTRQADNTVKYHRRTTGESTISNGHNHDPAKGRSPRRDRDKSQNRPALRRRRDRQSQPTAPGYQDDDHQPTLV